MKRQCVRWAVERDEHTMVYFDDTEKAISLNTFTKQRVIQAWRGLGFKSKVKADNKRNNPN